MPNSATSEENFRKENLSRNFKSSLKKYISHSNNIKYKNELIESAYRIFIAATMSSSIAADDYTEVIDEIVKPAIQELNIDRALAENFFSLLRDIQNEESEKRHAFHAIAVTLNAIHPAKICLRKIVHDLLMEQKKLDDEDTAVTNRNNAGYFFLSTEDVTHVRNKIAIINALLQMVSREIFDTSTYDGQKFYPVDFNVEQNIQHMREHIDSLSINKCETILRKFHQNLSDVLSPEDNENRNALRVHSFNQNYIFTFLSVLIKNIKDALGLKTSAEKLLENAVEEIHLSVLTK